MTNAQTQLISYAIFTSAGAICLTLATPVGFVVGGIMVFFGFISFLATKLK